MATDKQITQTQLDNFDSQAQDDRDQMKQTSDAFTDEAPDLKFNLPFGLGKLLHLPGEKQDEENAKKGQPS